MSDMSEEYENIWLRIEDISKKISYLWMIFSGMSVERLRRYVGGGRREESGRVA